MATWVSGIGTIGTVVVALYLAKRDSWRREKERKIEVALNDFRTSVLLLPAFGHLVAVADVLPERIAKLKVEYGGSMREAEELVELDCIRGMRQLADSARLVSRNLAVPVLSVFAWCDVFEKCLMDGYVREQGLIEVQFGNTRGSRFGDIYKILDHTGKQRQLRIAAAAIKANADQAVMKMRHIVDVDLGLTQEALKARSLD